MELGKKMAIFDWKWGQNLAPRERQKIPCVTCSIQVVSMHFQSPRKHRITQIGTHFFSLGRMFLARREFRVRMFF